MSQVSPKPSPKSYHDGSYCPGTILTVHSAALFGSESGLCSPEAEEGQWNAERLTTVILRISKRQQEVSGSGLGFLEESFRSEDPELFTLARSCGSRSFFVPLVDWLLEKGVGSPEFQTALRHYAERDLDTLVMHLLDC